MDFRHLLFLVYYFIFRYNDWKSENFHSLLLLPLLTLIILFLKDHIRISGILHKDQDSANKV